MKVIAQLIVIVGFCLGALGAAGFAREPEGLAIPFFAGGIVLLIAGALLRKGAQAEAGQAVGAESTRKEVFLAEIRALRDHVIELDEKREELDPEEIRQRIDQLFQNQYFDLTSRFEDLIALLGFKDYSRVWEGVANAERLLARAWSMLTDGFAEEGLEELPLARANLEQAAEAMASV